MPTLPTPQLQPCHCKLWLKNFKIFQEADEWKEYEDTKLDYTNLKIDTLKIEEDPDPNDDGDDVNEDGEKVKKSKEGGPWSKLVASDSLDKPSDGEEKTPGKIFIFDPL